MMINDKYTILVVDDAPEIAEILSVILSQDYHVKVASSGKLALELASDVYPPDIILLDVMMPEIDGFETCRRLKENPATQDIPVIFLTALNDANDEEKGLGLGAVDYIN